MITYIVLNGPPGCGKTTIARELARMLSEKRTTITDSFAAPMKHFIAVALGEKYNDMNKDIARPELNGYTVREFLIELSERHMKPRYGEDVFGRLLVHRSLRYTPPPTFVVCDDGGFQAELDAVPNHVLVWVSRAKLDFTNDSRSYLDNPHYHVDNDGHIDELWIIVRQLAHALLSAVK